MLVELVEYQPSIKKNLIQKGGKLCNFFQEKPKCGYDKYLVFFECGLSFLGNLYSTALRRLQCHGIDSQIYNRGRLLIMETNQQLIRCQCKQKNWLFAFE